MSSAGRDLFRGFSFVAPVILNEPKHTEPGYMGTSKSQPNVMATGGYSYEMPPPAVPPNGNTLNDMKKLQIIHDNLARINLIKFQRFEDDYIIKEVSLFFSVVY